jgi:phosphoribulokinase
MNKISTLLYFVSHIRSEWVQTNLPDASERGEEEEMVIDLDIYSPPDRTVNAILNFARSLEVKETKTAGEIEWVLN